MIRIVQFGEGNFLRAFADLYFDTLNREGGEYAIDIVKPVPFGSLDAFAKQNNRYHVVLRGMKEGHAVEEVFPVNSLRRVIDPFSDREAYLSLATDRDLRLIVSNTTEAGICFHAEDPFDGFEEITYPAKLTQFLYRRFSAGLDGVCLLPAELIDNNADELYRCVDSYIRLWGLPDAFRRWNDEKNFYCNTLVDRIVSGYPRDEAVRRHLWNLIGEEDKLLTVGEPFGLWAIENKGNIAEYVKTGLHNIEVVLTDDIGYYKKRKVRVLNGSHTNLVPVGLCLGKTTVDECMKDGALRAFVDGTLKEEIIPFVSDDVDATAAFAKSVVERFKNPYLNHRLLSIALNSVSKWKARNLPSFRDYYRTYGKIPPHLTIGFSYLMAIYGGIRRSGENTYTVDLPCGTVEIKDDVSYLSYFAEGGTVKEFLRRADVWGEDLGTYCGFSDAVLQNIRRIENGENLL